MPDRPATRWTPPRTVSHPALLPEGDDQRFRSVIYLMVLGLGRILACRDAFGRLMRLTPSQYAVLIGTAHTQGAQGISVRGLSEHVLLAAPHVTTEVGRLTRKGLLAKRTNPDDRRGVLVSLTPAGEAAIDAIAPVLRSTNDTLFDGVSASEFANLERFLRRLADNSARALFALDTSEAQHPGETAPVRTAPLKPRR